MPAIKPRPSIFSTSEVERLRARVEELEIYNAWLSEQCKRWKKLFREKENGMPKPDPKCDVCGAPATDWARDIRQLPGNLGDPVEFEYANETIKKGCAKHPVDSVEFDAQGRRTGIRK